MHVLGDSRRAITCSTEGGAILCAVDTCNVIERLPLDDRQPLCCALNKGELTIYLGCEDGGIVSYSFTSGEYSEFAFKASRPIVALALINDGGEMIVGCGDGSIQ